MNNGELRKLVLARLPIRDKQRILIKGYYPASTTSRKFEDNHYKLHDVTKQVHQLLKEGKLKRIRKYGYGKSGNAGNTFFVENTA